MYDSGYDTTNQQDRNDYDIAASQQVQAEFSSIATQLMGLLDQRDQDVQNTMAQYEADGVSDKYRQLEQNWYQAGAEVRHIIRVLEAAMADADGIASTALTKASNAVHL